MTKEQRQEVERIEREAEDKGQKLIYFVLDNHRGEIITCMKETIEEAIQEASFIYNHIATERSKKHRERETQACIGYMDAFINPNLEQGYHIIARFGRCRY